MLNVNVHDRSIINKCKTCLNFTNISMFNEKDIVKIKTGDIGKCEMNMNYNSCLLNLEK